MWNLQSQYIRKKRMESGKSQVEVGRALKHSAQHIANLERGVAGVPSTIAAEYMKQIKGDLVELAGLVAEDYRISWLDDSRQKAKRKK